MEESSITQYITDTFEGVDYVVASGDTFFFYDPEHKFPFATIVTKDDEYDNASHLNRPSVFRLNIGVSKQTFRALFPSKESSAEESASAESSFDLAALDRLMPHPVYGSMYWVCVLNPSTETFKTLQPLLAEAYELFVKKRTRARPSEES